MLISTMPGVESYVLGVVGMEKEVTEYKIRHNTGIGAN